MNAHQGTSPACGEARAWLSRRHDGEAELSSSAAAHVARCPSCSAFEAELGDLSGIFDELRSAEPPASLRARINEVASRRPARPARRSAHAWVLRAAAGLIGFVPIFAVESLRADSRARTHALEPLARAGRAFDVTNDLATSPERELLDHIVRITSRANAPEEDR